MGIKVIQEFEDTYRGQKINCKLSDLMGGHYCLDIELEINNYYFKGFSYSDGYDIKYLLDEAKKVLDKDLTTSASGKDAAHFLNELEKEVKRLEVEIDKCKRRQKVAKEILKSEL